MYLYYYLTIEKENNLPLFSFRLDNSLCLVYKKISIQFVLDHEFTLMNWTKPGDYTYIFSQRNTFIPNHSHVHYGEVLEYHHYKNIHEEIMRF